MATERYAKFNVKYNSNSKLIVANFFLISVEIRLGIVYISSAKMKYPLLFRRFYAV